MVTPRTPVSEGWLRLHHSSRLSDFAYYTHARTQKRRASPKTGPSLGAALVSAPPARPRPIRPPRQGLSRVVPRGRESEHPMAPKDRATSQDLPSLGLLTGSDEGTQ